MRASAKPGTWRSCPSNWSASWRLPSRFAPSIWISMGAGAPKFRIWEIISAGRKEKVAPANSSANLGRKARTNSATGRCFSFSEDIGVGGADQAGPVVNEVDRAVRQADVVE